VESIGITLKLMHFHRTVETEGGTSLRAMRASIAARWSP
jgi:hypothetical protein